MIKQQRHHQRDSVIAFVRDAAWRQWHSALAEKPYSFLQSFDVQSRSRYSRHRRWFPRTTKHPSSKRVNFFNKTSGFGRKVCRLQSLRSGSGKCISRKSRAVSGVNIKVLNTASCGEEAVDSVMVVRHLIFMMTRHYGYPVPLTSASFSLCETFSEEFSLRCNAYIGHGIVYAKMPGNHMLTGHQKFKPAHGPVA